MSRNKRIRWNPREKALIQEHRIKAFFVTSRKNLSGAKLGEIFNLALERMYELVDRYPGPFIAKIMSDGSVVRWFGTIVEDEVDS